MGNANGGRPGILEQIAIGLVPITIGFTAGRAWQRAKLLREYSYLRILLKYHNKVQIIVSHVEIARFRTTMGTGGSAHVMVPRNVLYMPMPEGRAIAALTSLLHKVNPRVRVHLVTAEHNDSELPTLSIGGPSVNAFSEKILKTEFPEFKIEYPATRRARYGGQLFETQLADDNMLTRDYGFIFLTRTAKDAPCMVFCGIRAFGTAMAVELLQKLPPRSDAAQLIKYGRKALIVAEGKVEGLEEVAVRLSSCREIPDEKTMAGNTRRSLTTLGTRRRNVTITK